MSAEENLHGTALAVGGFGVLLRGPSGAGKSDLALRCLALAPSLLGANPFRLVADDRVVARRTGAGVEVTAPETIRRLLEVRGVGVVQLPASLVANRNEPILLALVVDLSGAAVERLPQSPLATTPIVGVEVPRLTLAAFEASAPLKIALAMARCAADGDGASRR